MTQPPPQQMPPVGGGTLKPHRSTTVLVLGILSIVVCQILGPFAWLMGKADLKEMDAGVMDSSERGQTQAGMICGIVGSVFLILGLLYFIFVIVLIGGAIGFGASAS